VKQIASTAEGNMFLQNAGSLSMDSNISQKIELFMGK
jgi:hypothetical protein